MGNFLRSATPKNLQADKASVKTGRGQAPPENLASRQSGGRSGLAPRQKLDLSRISSPVIQSPPQGPAKQGGLETNWAFANAMPLEHALKSMFPKMNTRPFERLGQLDPVAAGCLSRCIENARTEMTSDRMDPRVADQHRTFFANTLTVMAEEIAASPRPGRGRFSQRVLTLAKQKVGTDDAALFGNLVVHHQAEKLGFRAARDAVVPSENGVCLRLATEFAGCAATGAPFKFKGIDVDSVQEKHGAYQADFLDKQRTLGLKTFDVASKTAYKWLDSFSDAGGQKHQGEVWPQRESVDNLSGHLRDFPLESGESMVVMMKWSGGGHAMTLSGTTEPQLYDPGTHTLYDFTRTDDLGKSLEQFARHFYTGDAQPTWTVIRVTASGLGQDGGAG